MSSDRRHHPCVRTLPTLALLAVAALVPLGCGYKKPPSPPPRKIPQTASIALHQRGAEALVSFPYPTLTISGTALSGVAKVEVWRLRQEVPAFAIGVLALEAQQRRDAAVLLEEHGVALFEPPPVEGVPDDPTALIEPGADGEPTADDVDAEEEPEEVIPEIDPATGLPILSPEEELQIQIDAALALLKTPETPIEQYITATASDFAAGSELILEVAGADLAGAVLGDQVVLRTQVPLPELSVAEMVADRAPPEEADEDDADPDAEAEESAAADEVELPEGDPLYGYLYSVRIFPTDGNASDFSPTVAIFPILPPAAPSNVKVKATPTGVTIDWDAAEEPESGFRVYRREAHSKLYGPPVATLVDTARTHLDSGAVYGARYIYGVTAVGRATPLVESELSSEHELDYRDRFGPDMPTGLVAFPERGRIRLLWDASDATDFAGYQVLRRAESAADAAPLTEALVTRSQYVDETVSTGEVWYYSVVAVDESGNESDPSDEITVRAP